MEVDNINNFGMVSLITGRDELNKLVGQVDINATTLLKYSYETNIGLLKDETGEYVVALHFLADSIDINNEAKINFSWGSGYWFKGHEEALSHYGNFIGIYNKKDFEKEIMKDTEKYIGIKDMNNRILVSEKNGVGMLIQVNNAQKFVIGTNFEIEENEKGDILYAWTSGNYCNDVFRANEIFLDTINFANNEDVEISSFKAILNGVEFSSQLNYETTQYLLSCLECDKFEVTNALNEILDELQEKQFYPKGNGINKENLSNINDFVELVVNNKMQEVETRLDIDSQNLKCISEYNKAHRGRKNNKSEENDNEI